ncbi:MAG: PLP-dependent aspartate aminotransferase family protein [Pyrinomonadaceae bacterium]
MTQDKNDLDIASLVVHAGERGSVPEGQPVSTPIYASATFTYDSMQEIDQVFAGEKSDFIYTRYGNPTTAALQTAVREIEGGATACAYASGMAALHAALYCCDLKPGSTILASQDLYGATTNLLLTIFGSFEVKPVFTDFNDLAQLREQAFELRPQALLAETISNPLLKVCDIEACAEIAHSVNARLIVDNTFASPYLCRPLAFGANLVVHSATKYLSGHADAMGGVVISHDELDTASLVGVMKLVGGVLSVWEAHQILRGLKTLAIRVERQCENARLVAERLRHNRRVARVYYPGSTGETREVTQRMLREPYAGALVSIELAKNSRQAAFNFMNALRLCVRSTSLGDVFTSVLHPATSSHRDLAPAHRSQLGISDGLVRISVGIENANDILDDLEHALRS